MIIRTKMGRLTVALLLALLCAACVPLAPQPEVFTVLDPLKHADVEWEAQVVSHASGQCISPGGEYFLAALRTAGDETMTALPLDLAEGGVPLHSVPTSWSRYNRTEWFPVGWRGDTSCAFVLYGWQYSGPNQGERGAAIFVGDTLSGESRQVGWMPIPDATESITGIYLEDSRFLRVGTDARLWEVDLHTETTRLVADGLPNYGGIAKTRLSPHCDHAAYSVYEEAGRQGAYVLDAETGTEVALMPTTPESMGFYPTWSPDGTRLFLYTAHTSASSGYDTLPGEDGPLAAASVLTVMSPEGAVTRTIALPEQYIFNASWLGDSASIIFLSGEVVFGTWGEVRSVDYTGVWVAAASGDSEPTKVADFGDLLTGGSPPLWVYPVASLPDGSGAFFQLVGDDSSEIWRVSISGPATHITDGYWANPRLSPAYLDSVATVIVSGDRTALWMMGPDRCFEVDELPQGTDVLGFDEEYLIMSTSHFGESASTVQIWRMLGESAIE